MMEFQLSISIYILLFFILTPTNQVCDYQRCCNVSPCTQSYCIQRTSQTWISSENYALYQFTKLVLSNSQCMPCPYNCKSCSSASTCQTCYDGYYKSDDGQCLLCSYKCKKCTISNGIEKCSQCLQGTYLDDTSLSCKSCPLGAKSCSSSTAIIECQSGYLKSSNSLFCTSCPDNCLSCPLSDSYCSSCQTGYYLSSGSCKVCTKTNCQACLGVGSTVYCTTCNQDYIVASGQCLACPSNCRTCSSTTICTACLTGFYVKSGGCQSVTTTIANCYKYSSATSCETCSSKYYLDSSVGKCIPCSITCTSCYGNHFGRCTQCAQEANLFNQMCIIDPFPSSLMTRKFYALPGSSSLLSGGSLQCQSQLYSGHSLSITLNDLEAYKIVMKIKIFGQSPNQLYSISLNSDQLDYTISSTGYQLCNSTSLYISIQENITFSTIALENSLTFFSSSILYLSEIILTAYKCNSLCIQCSQTQCFTCINNNLYTQDSYCVYVCSKGYYTYQDNKECVQQCPEGTYLSLSTAQCLTCIQPCYSCLSQDICLSCIENYYLTSDNTCEQQCPYRYYGNIQTQVCEKCVGRCLECTDDENCLSCKIGFLENTSCVDECETSLFFQDLQTLACVACQSPCLQCQYLANHCLTCVDGYFFHNNTCLSACPDGYYSTSDNICLQCEYPCENCQTGPTNCLSCVDKYLLEGACYTQCPDGFYEDNIELDCKQCAIGCQICYLSANNCFQCSDGYFLFENQCISNCPEQFYGDSKLCEACDGFCYACLNQTYCLKCQSNFLQDGQCVRASQCTEGTYADISTLTCLICSPQCATCSIQSTKCTSCSDQALVLYDNTCVSECPSSYYYQNDGLCELCESPCVTCINQTHCLSCQQGYKYSSTTNLCSSTCGIGTYFDSVISDCSECNMNCMICQNSDFCYLCSDGYYVHVADPQVSQNQCLQECPQAYYPNGLSCSACLFPCITCQTSIDCLSCATGILYEKRCLSGCPDSTFKSGDECISCAGNCLTCYNTSLQCLSCQDTFYLYNEDCISQCPFGTYAFEAIQQCYQCPQTCESCLNSTYCLTCIIGETFLTPQNQCISQCPSGYFGEALTSVCELCESKCLTCQDTSDNCLTCSQGYLLVKLTSSVSDCVEACPATYYQENPVCYLCVYPCKECYNSIQCKSCIDGMYYHAASKSCLLTCPFGTYYNITNSGQKVCSQCVSPCNTCTNQTFCISCQDSLLLYNGKCVVNCPDQYYHDSSGICNRCYGLCETCSGKYYCLTCHSGYAYDGFCYSSCPPGTYADPTTKRCEACQSPCLECVGSASYCKRCQFNYYAYKGSCQQQCPKGTYQSGQLCQTCQFPCIDCSNQFICNQCIGGYLLYMKASCIENVQKCPNDLYKMNSKECVPITWCPDSYYKDTVTKTCSTTCSRQKYIKEDQRKCLSECETGQYVGQNMACENWITNPPISLMGLSSLTFIKSSVMHIVLDFNETESWLENSEALYTLLNSDLSRRMLSPSSMNYLKYKNIGQKEVALVVTQLPTSCQVLIPAYYVKSQQTNYNLQTTSISVSLPEFTPYTYSQIYTGELLGQFSQGLSWFIILFTFFFLVVNRVSDVYILWDTAQFLYLLIFLNIQYPPNLNQFLLGMSNTHFLFIPSIFTNLISVERNVSYAPFYAYSFDSNFLRTAGSSVFIGIIVLSIFLILKFIETLIIKVDKLAEKMKEYPKVKKTLFKWLLRFRWHHTSDLFFLTYDIILLYAVSEIVQIQNNPDNVPSLVFSFFMLILYIVFPLFVGYKLYKHYPNIAKGRMVRNLQCFYRGIEKQNKFGVSLILIRYFRKILYCILIGVFSIQPMFALPILMFMSVIMALFIFINKPYRKRLSNIITILTEVCLVIFFLIVAIIEFINSDNDTNFILGWIACGFLSIMLFALVFEVFCKTLFFLEPQKKQQAEKKKQFNEQLLEDKELKGKYSEQYLRQKAGQFFHLLFPKIRQELGMNESDQEFLGNHEDGDSQNSQNNQERQRKWGFEEDEEEEKKSDEFRHYGGSNSSESGELTQAIKDKQEPPAYLIRCVKEL